MTERKALLVVSFGTSHTNTLEKNIAAIEQTVAAHFPGLPLRRAFTSEMILKVWRERDRRNMDTAPQALTRLEQEGFTHVVIQPTHIMNGDEFDKLAAQARPFRERMTLTMGAPLLTEVADYKAVAGVLMEAVQAPAEGEALVFMGHGTGHHANAAYAQMEYVLHDFGWKRAFLGTVEGYPALEEVLRRLAEHPEVKQVRLHPFMVVAGDHAVNDMAGEEEDSWKSRLESAGYRVSCVLKGLGEYPGIRELFAAHALAAN